MKRTLLSFLIILCTALAIQAQPAPVYTLKSCLEQGLLNNYSLRITRNEQQVSKNNATLANAGYLPTLDLSAGYKGTLDNTETKLRATGETTKENGVFDQTVDAGINLSWTIFDGFNITANYQKLKELERQGETNTRIAIEDLIANYKDVISSPQGVYAYISSDGQIYYVTDVRCPFEPDDVVYVMDYHN